jgi:hypothetical protein
MQTLQTATGRYTLAPTRDSGAFQAQLAKFTGKTKRTPLRADGFRRACLSCDATRCSAPRRDRWQASRAANVARASRIPTAVEKRTPRCRGKTRARAAAPLPWKSLPFAYPPPPPWKLAALSRSSRCDSKTP